MYRAPVREVRFVLEELLERTTTIEVAGEPEWTRSNRLFGLRHLPVRMMPIT